MSKLVRRKKEIGAALFVALQLTTLTLIGLMLPFGNGPHQSAKAPAGSQVSAAQTQTDQALTATDKANLRASAVFGKKLYEPLASQVFNLGASRAAAAENAQKQNTQKQNIQGPESPNEGPTLTTDQEDYQPYTYVYFTGTGFEPGETVNMIVVEIDPIQQSFEPWDVVADENGNFQTSWYVFSEEFRGATFQATATGQSSGLNASATFTDGCVDVTVTSINGNPAPTPKPIVTLTTLPQTINVLFDYDTHGTAGTTTATVELVGASPAVTNGPITISSGAHTGQLITLLIPSGTANGTYNVKVTLNYDDGHGNCNGNDNVSQGVNINVASPTPTPTATATATSPTPTPTATATATFSPTPTPTPTPTPASTNLTVAAASGTYGGSVNLTATLTSGSGVSGKNIIFTLNGNSVGSGVTDGSGVATVGPVTLCGASYNAGNYPGGVAASFAGDTSYAPASGSNSLTIGKADATINVTPYSTTYNCSAHMASGTATGVCSDGDLSSLLNLSGTSHTDAGDYPTDGWTFNSGNTNPNYNSASGTVHDSIAQATATINVTPYNVTYNCLAHTATGTATGVCTDDLSAGLSLGGTTHTNAGSYNDSWTFHDANGNYSDASGNVTDDIAQATATISVTPYSVTYNCAAHTATGTATGVCSDDLAAGLSLSGTTHTNAGTYNDSWTFHDAAGNYNDASGNVTDQIDKATASISVTPYSVTYNCAAHTATGTATGVCSDDLAAGLSLGGTTHTNAGTYNDSWTFHDAAGNYNDASGNVTDQINKAHASISVTPYGVTYNCAAHTATGTATGCDGNLSSLLDLSGTSHTDAGDYLSDGWTFNSGNTNTNYFSESGSVHDHIDKANASIMVNPYHVTYDCNAHTSTGSATGVCSDNLTSLLHLPASHTNAGDYPSDSWTFDGNANYNGTSGTVHNQIDKAHATINVTPYNVVYDAAAHTATGTATGCDGNLSSLLNLTGTTHTLPSDYPTDAWTFNSANTNTNYFSESGTVHDIISYGTCTAGSGHMILPPINSNGTSVYNRKRGSTVPVKFRVCDASGNNICDPNAVFASGVGGSITMLSELRGTVNVVNEDNSFDLPDVAFTCLGDHWQFNMDTMTLHSGSDYTFRINLKDGSSITFIVGVK